MENKHTPERFCEELKRLAEKVKGWSSCNAAWAIVDKEEPEYLTAAVGAIGDDGDEYPVVIVDCDKYFSGSDSLHLANFYAAANPKIVLDIIKQRDELLSALEKAYEVATEHDDRLPFDWAVYCEMLYSAIAKAKGTNNV